MIDREVAIEALSALCNANVTSTQKQVLQAGFTGEAAQQQLSIPQLIATVLNGEETSQASTSNFACLQGCLEGGGPGAGFAEVNQVDFATLTGVNLVIDENEFFDPRFDHDFTTLKDTETYHRGGEVYERPCGWQRFAVKVLNKYDGNDWLGTRYRTTQSVPGEWPVSYHGTSETGAHAIIAGFYQPGPRQVYGRGVYSTPYMSEAIHYAKTFSSKKTGKKYQVILQNRINPKYREKHNKGKYWLVPIPKATSGEDERKMVERAIRAYGLLLKEV